MINFATALDNILDHLFNHPAVAVDPAVAAKIVDLQAAHTADAGLIAGLTTLENTDAASLATVVANSNALGAVLTKYATAAPVTASAPAA